MRGKYVCFKICTSCGNQFQAQTGRALKCDDCKKCRQCGKPLYESLAKFCGHKCAARWNVDNNPKMKSIQEVGFDWKTDPEKAKKRSEAISKSRMGKTMPRGPDNKLWKGNKTERRNAMERIEYKTWRATVFKRDDHTCVICGKQEIKVEAHHIKKWANDEKLRYDPENGVTLCKDCHKSITGIEESFEVRFSEYVSRRDKVYLSEEKLERLKPFMVNCSFCEKLIRKKNCFRGRKYHFCDKKCKQDYERKIGYDWTKDAAKVE